MAIELLADPSDESSNAYATPETAVAYAEARIPDANTRAFLDLDAEQMSQALITARRDIDSQPGFAYELEDGEYPEPIVRASIELGISYAPMFADDASGDAYEQARDNGNIKRERVEGAVDVEYFAAEKASGTDVARWPGVVQRLLEPYIMSVEGRWGSADVGRGS